MSNAKRAELLEKVKKVKKLMEDLDDIDIGGLKKACERIEDFMDDNGLVLALEECPFYTPDEAEHHPRELMDLVYRAREKCPFCGAELFLY
ncbi:MAG: hypothetical protein GYA24_18855 [Candidatus Lokiarchaeota archaeon]|nr:hypothetical protein [Candidatus Lokiarchaeota archaeon]